MSRENVEAAKRGIELWNRGDMDALRERYHPNAVMHHPPRWPEPGPSIGREAIMGQLRRLRESAATDQLHMTVVADPGDWVVWDFQWSATGAESQLPMGLVGGLATRYSDGKIVEQRFYATPEEALEAARLSE